MPEGKTPDNLVWSIMSKKQRVLGNLVDSDMSDGTAAMLETAFEACDVDKLDPEDLAKGMDPPGMCL